MVLFWYTNQLTELKPFLPTPKAGTAHPGRSALPVLSISEHGEGGAAVQGGTMQELMEKGTATEHCCIPHRPFISLAPVLVKN